MLIGNRIKYYREKMGITQAELAFRVNVSSQAVSKWETDISLPDITLIPALADLFSVSCDALLLESETCADEAIAAIISDSYEANIDALKTYLQVVKDLEDSVKRYPRSCALLLRLAEVYSYNCHDTKKAIACLERVLSLTDIPAERYTAIQLLCYLYGDSDFEQTLLLAKSMPEIYQTRQALAYHAYVGAEKQEKLDEYFYALLDTAEGIFSLSADHNCGEQHFKAIRQLYDSRQNDGKGTRVY